MKHVVLFSGGLDSTVCLAMAVQEGVVTALTVNYGQIAAESERRTSAHIAAHYGVQHVYLDLRGFGQLAGSALTTGGDVAVPQQTVVPGRNAMLLSVAASYAQTIGAHLIWIGCNLTDSEHYADCRPSFISAMREVVQPVNIKAPLLRYSKRDVVSKANELGVRVDWTSSCYTGTGCGKCAACMVRSHALANDA